MENAMYELSEESKKELTNRLECVLDLIRDENFGLGVMICKHHGRDIPVLVATNADETRMVPLGTVLSFDELKDVIPNGMNVVLDGNPYGESTNACA